MYVQKDVFHVIFNNCVIYSDKPLMDKMMWIKCVINAHSVSKQNMIIITDDNIYIIYI